MALKIERLKLESVRQFEYRCEPRKKIDFLMAAFDEAATTQSIIFVNTKSFAETVFNIMKKNGYKVSIIFGDMSKEERDEMMDKFRNQ